MSIQTGVVVAGPLHRAIIPFLLDRAADRG
jgi:hypothetical protein